MSKSLQYIFGPELLWMIIYGLTILLIKLSHARVKQMDSLLVNTAFIVPLILIPITFTVYYWPASIHKWMLLRIWIAGMLGSHFVLSRTLGAHSEGGPGVGTAYMMGMIIVIVMLIAGSIFALIKFR